jgi:hypothetical protein
LYIDFIYGIIFFGIKVKFNKASFIFCLILLGALLKMKEYNAHTSLEAYRKLMELFPVGNKKKFILLSVFLLKLEICALKVR